MNPIITGIDLSWKNTTYPDEPNSGPFHHGKKFLNKMCHDKTPWPHKEHFVEFLNFIHSHPLEWEFLTDNGNLFRRYLPEYGNGSKYPPGSNSPVNLDSQEKGFSCQEIQSKLNNLSLDIRKVLEQDRQSIRNDTKEIISKLRELEDDEKNPRDTKERLESYIRILEQNQDRIINRLDEINDERIRDIQDKINKILERNNSKPDLKELADSFKKLVDEIKENDNRNKKELEAEIRANKPSGINLDIQIPDLGTDITHIKNCLEQLKNDDKCEKGIKKLEEKIDRNRSIDSSSLLKEIENRINPRDRNKERQDSEQESYIRKLEQNQERIINRLDEINNERIQDIQDKIGKMLKRNNSKPDLKESEDSFKKLVEEIKENDNRNKKELEEEISSSFKGLKLPDNSRELKDLKDLLGNLEEEIKRNSVEDTEKIKDFIQQHLDKTWKKLVEIQERKIIEIREKGGSEASPTIT